MIRRIGLLLLVSLILLPVVLAFQKTETGDSILPTFTTQPKCPWRLVAAIVDANTSPGVDDRAFSALVATTSNSRGVTTYTEQTTVDADPNWVVWKVPTDARTVQFIAAVDADGDDAVVEIWGCAGPYLVGTSSLAGSFQLCTTVTWKGGTQVGPASDVYCDTATTSDATLIGVAFDSGTNRIAVVTVNLGGLDAIAFVGTTVDTNCDIYARWSN
jgi:hypothetical protein